MRSIQRRNEAGERDHVRLDQRTQISLAGQSNCVQHELQAGRLERGADLVRPGQVARQPAQPGRLVLGFLEVAAGGPIHLLSAGGQQARGVPTEIATGACDQDAIACAHFKK